MSSSLNLEKERYAVHKCCIFRMIRGPFGGFSNMSPGFPLVINGNKIQTSEALYQSCKFPHKPEIQSKIIEQKSPISAKNKSKEFDHEKRNDWYNIRVLVMDWCLRVKLAQNFDKFGRLLESTIDDTIVEESKSDNFWGACRIDKPYSFTLEGINALGKLLMRLRSVYGNYPKSILLKVDPIKIYNPNYECKYKFELLGEKIPSI